MFRFATANYAEKKRTVTQLQNKTIVMKSILQITGCMTGVLYRTEKVKKTHHIVSQINIEVNKLNKI